MSDITSVIIVVDTKQYSGNFEREMCAYITGQVGDCGVGEPYAECAHEECTKPYLKWFENHIVQMPDEEHGSCYRPCVIWPTPGRVNDGFGGHFDEETFTSERRWPAYESVAIFVDEVPPADIMQTVVNRAYQYDEDEINVQNVRVLVPTVINVETKKKLKIQHVLDNEYKR